MARYYSLILLLCTSLLVSAQSNHIFRIQKDSLPISSLDARYWQMLPDPSGKLGPDQAAQMKFRASQTTPVQFDKATVYWLRFDFQNTLDRPVRLVLSADFARSDLYIRDSTGHWLHKVNGSDVPWSMRADDRGQMTVNYTVPARKTLQIYDRISFVPSVDYPSISFRFRLGNDSPTLLQDYYDNLFAQNISYSALSGLILLASIITLLFYTVSREGIFLWFTLFGISYSFPNLVVGFFDTYFREHPLLFQNLLIAYILLSAVFLAQFLAVFYHIPQHYRRWHRFNILLAGLLLLAWISRTIWPYNLGIQLLICRFSAVLFILSNLFSLIFGIFRKGPGRKERMVTALPFIMVGSELLILLILELTTAINAKTVHMLEDWSGWITMICFFWLIVSFMWSLIKRFQQLQKQMLQETLERERLGREHEQERLMLMAEQKILLERQVEERTVELQQSLSELKQTQNQLIQSEKMASLGELTAGIAHEIQNPLNFVNNFSEVSVELLTELKEEVKAGRTNDVLDMAEDLTQNLEKIHHHGKRADNIVKGMLEHSRAGSGRKEATDLNKLADEYLQLAYHGLRAKDNNFNATLISQFDDQLPRINVISQDIGRVLLNLLNNAFYAVRERQQTAGTGYQPKVEIATKHLNGQVEITVKDNGSGIPEAIRDKIMQPFFTTKPTGQGTGLGLSLSYDIIVKGHGGSINVKSITGESTAFIISLPLS